MEELLAKIEECVLALCTSSRLVGPARMGRVSFSKTGETLYYKGKSFQSLKGSGFKQTTSKSKALDLGTAAGRRGSVVGEQPSDQDR
jgi:hypothetical protein